MHHETMLGKKLIRFMLISCKSDLYSAGGYFIKWNVMCLKSLSTKQGFDHASTGALDFQVQG